MRARLVSCDPNNLPCYNCGRVGVVHVQAISESCGTVGWQGCVLCWHEAIAKGQLEIIRGMMRSAVAKRKAAQAGGQLPSSGTRVV